MTQHGEAPSNAQVSLDLYKHPPNEERLATCRIDSRDDGTLGHVLGELLSKMITGTLAEIGPGRQHTFGLGLVVETPEEGA